MAAKLSEAQIFAIDYAKLRFGDLDRNIVYRRASAQLNRLFPNVKIDIITCIFQSHIEQFYHTLNNMILNARVRHFSFNELKEEYEGREVWMAFNQVIATCILNALKQGVLPSYPPLENQEEERDKLFFNLNLDSLLTENTKALSFDIAYRIKRYIYRSCSLEQVRILLKHSNFMKKNSMLEKQLQPIIACSFNLWFLSMQEKIAPSNKSQQ